MSKFEIIQADVMEWASEYDGPKYHALLTDAPFHLTANSGGLETCPKCGAKMARRYRYCHQCGGEMDTEAAKAGFMGKDWDGGILAFQPELWQALARHLYPGAFILAFASGRGWHRVAVALEDAGLVYQPDVHVHGVGVVDCAPLLYHVCGQAFPKSSRIDTQIDKRKGYKPGLTREICRYLREARNKKDLTNKDIADVFGFDSRMAAHWCAEETDSQPAIPRLKYWSKLKEMLDLDGTYDEAIEAHEREVVGKQTKARKTDCGIALPTVGETEYQTWDITAPATPLARAWAGHRYGGQILRDLSLPIVVAQKPWTTPRLDCIIDTGSGAMNVELARVGYESGGNLASNPSLRECIAGGNGGHVIAHEEERRYSIPSKGGRWPPNCIFTHHPLCTPVLVPAPCPDCSGTGGSDGNGGACGRCGGSGSVEVGAVERVKGIKGGGDGNAMSIYGSDVSSRRGQGQVGYADANGTEPQSRYRCARHCPGCGCWWLSETADVCPECGREGEWACSVKLLGEDSGERGQLVKENYKRNSLKFPGSVYEHSWTRRDGNDKGANYSDKGTAARFFPNPDFSHETAERLALGQTRKYAAKPAPREKSAGLERFVWRKGKSGHTRIWSDAAVDQFWHWQQERKGLPGEGFDKWLVKCGESKRKVHKIPYTWGNIHPTVKSISLNTWICNLISCPSIYAPRRLLIPFLGSGSEMAAAILSGQWEHVTGIEQSAEYCEIAESRARFWTGWSAATGETEVKPILKAAKKAQEQPGQTPIPPPPQPHQLPMEVSA